MWRRIGASRLMAKNLFATEERQVPDFLRITSELDTNLTPQGHRGFKRDEEQRSSTLRVSLLALLLLPGDGKQRNMYVRDAPQGGGAGALADDVFLSRGVSVTISFIPSRQPGTGPSEATTSKTIAYCVIERRHYFKAIAKSKQ